MKLDTNHHAHVLEGEKGNIVPDLFKFLKKELDVDVKNNPDFSYQEFETFTIDDGRDLQERHGRKAITGKKIFVIVTRFIVLEAQNALLKIFEEPSVDTHFFLIMPNASILIPTLRSRVEVVRHSELDKEKGSELKTLAKKFISASPAQRIVIVKEIVEEKDKGKAIDFVTALEEVLAPKLKSAPDGYAGALTEILMVKKYLHDRAPSVKLLLEHLCLSVTITA
jgi:DNA polymerase-3 subunit delta'